jgi:hypothetical protein
MEIENIEFYDIIYSQRMWNNRNNRNINLLFLSCLIFYVLISLLSAHVYTIINFVWNYDALLFLSCILNSPR